ncbi:tyrosine-type recombinase/integrase [Streptomyces sp. NPDC053431]|uniref:tyrosine-type recombinase/integrase n=1 Tax=Streptomyces sp. NPDC053431 TaxID=3365703 RepID=UPI0037D4D0D2
MPAIDAIACPFQRAALLVARWSAARRTEIQRLPLDCLDRYPDGTARLRLSGRKTYKERVVPLHEDAAEALQKVIDLRRNAPERPFTDERTGEEIRYLFMSHGKPLSTYYLFETSIQAACKAVGLVRPGGAGRGTVSAHRFRHTVGTQLAERGAKLPTIMKVLGHTSVNMALVYAQISDQKSCATTRLCSAPAPRSPAQPPTNCATARCRKPRSTGSRPTSLRPNSNSAAVSGSPPKAPASATST